MSEGLSVRAAAHALGVSERTIWRRLRSGELASVREGRRVWVKLWDEPASHRVDELRAEYLTSADASAAEVPWPFDPTSIARRRARLLARRRAAADDMDRLSARVRPDPAGLTGLDYLLELREGPSRGSEEADGRTTD